MEHDEDVREVVRVSAPAILPAIMPAMTLEEAQQNLDRWAKLKRLAIASTSPEDWREFGTEPYLEARGALAFGRIYGVSTTDMHVDAATFSDERGPVIEYYASCVAHWMGRTMPGEGVASTADDVWNGTEDDPARPGKKRARRLPLSEIDRASVRKKAITQSKANGIKDVLGLRFTWDEVRAGLGERATKIGSVQYQGRSEFKPDETGKGQNSPVKKELHKIVMELAEGDQTSAENFIEAWSAFVTKEGKQVPGVRSIVGMTEKRAAVVLGIAKKKLAEIRAQEGGAA